MSIRGQDDLQTSGLPCRWGGLFSSLPPPPPVLRLLHLFAARGLRWAAYAAAEVLQMYRQLDIREHKGKVRARSPDFSTCGRGHLTFRGEDSGSPG